MKTQVKLAGTLAAGLFFVLWATQGCVPIRQQVSPGGKEAQAPEESGTEAVSTPEAAKPETAKPEGSTPESAPKAGTEEMEGQATWYGLDSNGRLTSSGEVYDMYLYTAAHATLPLGTLVRVTNLENGKITEVKINDRGPLEPGNILTLSRTAGKAIGLQTGNETAQVKLEIVPQSGEN